MVVERLHDEYSEVNSQICLQDLNIASTLASNNRFHGNEILHILQKPSLDNDERPHVHVVRMFLDDHCGFIGGCGYENRILVTMDVPDSSICQRSRITQKCSSKEFQKQFSNYIQVANYMQVTKAQITIRSCLVTTIIVPVKSLRTYLEKNYYYRLGQLHPSLELGNCVKWYNSHLWHISRFSFVRGM